MIKKALLLLFVVVAGAFATSRADGGDAGDGGQLGTRCVQDEDCEESVPNSRCLDGRCICKPYHASYNMTACLPASLLGAACVTEAQCSNRVTHSECVEHVCACKRGYLQYRKHTCLEAARPGSVCYGHAHCRMWDQASKCDFLIPGLFGRCQCSQGTRLVGDSCARPDEVASFHIEVAKINASGAPPPPAKQPLQHAARISLATNELPPSTRRVDAMPVRIQSEDSPSLQITYKRDTSGGSTGKGQGGALGNRLSLSASSAKKGGSRTPITLGKACMNDGQCRAADPNSRCHLGVCDCAGHARNSTKKTCGATFNGCAPTTFQCRSVGRCISYFFVCDGRKDCPDGSDELGCGGPDTPGAGRADCPDPSFRCERSGRCVSLAARCDGSPQCPHGEDEAGCHVGKGQSCPTHTFACGDGQCLPEYEFCNSVMGCSDGSDEAPQICRHGHAQLSRGSRWERRGTYKYRYRFALSAGGHLSALEVCPLRCRNSRCRAAAIACSGRDGCGDNSDEESCNVCRCPAL